MTTHARRRRRQATPAEPLWPDEQDELVTKLRFGIGLEQLVGEGAAADIKRSLPRSRLGAGARRERSPSPPEALVGALHDRVHDEAGPSRAARAVARLGRGHGLGRGWR